MPQGFCVMCGQASGSLNDAAVCSTCNGAESDATLPTEVGTVPAETTANRSPPNEAAVGEVWEPGDVLLDLYEVRGVLGEGGFGTVYRVHHRGWDLDLAVKSPKPGVEGFAAEAEAWVGLGLHPQIVTCHYVRTLGGIPRVFAELVEGGSLHDWIENGRLYEGPEDGMLAGMLDIAIQFAWGIAYAHDQGLIHQDVKPANVLLTPGGDVKVTDFGLAHAKSRPIEPGDDHGGRSLLVDAGSYTPGYASPEQVEGDALSRRTDVWSWAVSVLEMFTGGRTWGYGQAAPHVLDGYRAEGPQRAGMPPMPETLEILLGECLRRDPGQRPRDFSHVARRLIDIYEDTTGEAYPRQRPTAAELRGDQLNNKALSLLDLRRREDAEVLLAEALSVDAHHIEATYNRGLMQWRSGRITDLDLVAQLEELRTSYPDAWLDDYLLGLVHIERGDSAAAQAALDQAQPQPEGVSEFMAAKATIERSAEDWCEAGGPFSGHTGRILAVAALPGTRLAASAGKDGSIRVWDVEAGETVLKLVGLAGRITSMAALPGGHRVVSGGGDGSVRLWDVEAGRSTWSIRGHAGAVTSVAALSDGRSVVSGGEDGSVRMWDVEAGQVVGTFEGHVGTVTSVAVSRDGRRLLSAGADGTVRAWDPATGDLTSTLEAHVGAVLSLTVSSDGRYIVSGGEDRSVRVWDARSMALSLTLTGHTGSVLSLAVSADGSRVLSGGLDRSVRVWDTASGSLLRTLEGHTEAVNGVALWPDATLAVSVSDDLTVRTWRLGFGPQGAFALSRPHLGSDVAETEARARAALDDAQRALTVGRPQEAALIVAEARELSGFRRSVELLEVNAAAGLHGRRSALAGAWQAGSFAGHTGRILAVATGLDGPAVAFGGEDGILRIRDPSSKKVVRTAPDHPGAIRAIAVVNDGRRVVSAGDEGTLALWDSTQEEALHRMEGHIGAVHAVAVCADGRWLASAGHDLTVRVWDAASGELLRMLEGHTDTVRAIAVTPDGRRLVSGGDDETLRVWDVASGSVVRIVETHTEWLEPGVQPRDGRRVEPQRGPRHAARIVAVAVSSDGRVCVTGGTDARVRVWDAQSGELLQTLEGHRGAVRGVAITPDSRWLVSAAVDGTVRVWDIQSGAQIRTLQGHAGAVNGVAIDREGLSLVSGGEDGTIRIWQLDWEYEFPDPTSWDERARPYLENFLSLHASIGLTGRRTEPGTTGAQPTRSWSGSDFGQLLVDLSRRGFGWLQASGVRAELEEMASQRDRRGR